MGKRMPRSWHQRPTRSQIAGEPNVWVTCQSSMASTILAGSTAAGREGSMSGMTAVAPMAQLNSPKSGKQGRSTSPGWIP